MTMVGTALPEKGMIAVARVVIPFRMDLMGVGMRRLRTLGVSSLRWDRYWCEHGIRA
jgi:hypothetical protein